MVVANRSDDAALVGSVKPSRRKLAASDASSCSTHFCLDIDDEAEAPAAPLPPEQLLRLVDTIPSLIWCLTADGELSYYNKRLVDWFGLDLADIGCPGKSLLAAAIENVVHPDDRAAVHERLTHSCSTGEPFDMKYRQRRADGAYRLTHCRAEPLRDTHGQIMQWYGVVTDIEDEARAQNALRYAQSRLARAAQAASLAELSASIAHEVNQPLAAIVANAHACQRWLSADPPNIGRARIVSERIVRNANLASDVVNRIRALFEQSTSARSAANINDVIMQVCRLMGDQIRMGSAEVKYELDAGLSAVLMDRVQIQQVLVNLIRNAIEALGRTLQEERLLSIRSFTVANEQVCVEVADTGAGFDDAEQIFEPFFTTKEGGMGMGLKICRSIIASHGGRLWAEKNQPHGARFIFTLPIEAKTVP